MSAKISEPLITVAGLRGILGEQLTPEVAMRYAVAFSVSVKKKGAFVITRDSRPSGELLTDAICSALSATGRDTIDAGITATPTTGILIRHLNAAGGIQISASHNPSEYNGLKLFTAEGRVISKEPGQAVLETYKKKQCDWVRYDKLAQRKFLIDSTSIHLQTVLQTVDVKAIQKRGFKVLLDSNHGAGAVLGRKLLEALNCDVTILGEKPNGQFLHTPEPTPVNLVSVTKQAKKIKSDITFCQDPDADRLALIDANGRYIGEEYTVALCIDHVLATRPKSSRKPAVVINCATSRMTEDIAAKYGAVVFRSPVGEANVVDWMKAKKAVFGGEGNGGPINPQVGYVRDSFVGMALLLDMMAKTGKSVADLANAFPKYALVKRKTSVELAKVPAMLDKVAKAFKSLPCDRMDGLRINHGNAWVLLRGSNTEPIIRIFAESPTEEHANSLCDEIEKVLQQ